MSKRVLYKVKGLDCVEEVNLLNKAVGQKPGVLELDFQVINAKMNVLYDPGVISPEDIVVAVAATGMSARPARASASGAIWLSSWYSSQARAADS